MTVKSYRDLQVWQTARILARDINFLVQRFPNWERFSLADQMRRSATSIMFNISEGQERKSTKEFIQFLSIARGSKGEQESQLIYCMDVGYLTQDETANAMKMLKEIGYMLSTLMLQLKKSNGNRGSNV